MENNEKKIIHLYSHSLEAEEAVEKGEAIKSVGGIRRSDGTIMDPPKPLSMTLDELKETIGGKSCETNLDKKLEELGKEINLSQKGIEEVRQIGWLNNAVLGQTYSLSYAGFQKTLESLEYINKNINELGQHIRLKERRELAEKTEKYISYLKSDAQKIMLPGFSFVSSNVDEHIIDIYVFIKTIYEGLLDGTTDGFLACSILEALLFPFADLVKMYVVLFYYDYGTIDVNAEEWIKLISIITSNSSFRNKLQYYICLETEMPYKDKVALGRIRIKRISALLNTIRFDMDYALYHRKEEYLDRIGSKTKIISLVDSISNEENLYL